MNEVDLTLKKIANRKSIYQTGDYFVFKRTEVDEDALQPPFSYNVEDVYILAELDKKSKQYNVINIQTGEQWDPKYIFASAQRAGETAVTAGMERLIPGDTFTIKIGKSLR